MRNSSVVPVELNSGLTATMTTSKGSCQENDFATARPPRSHTPQAIAMANEIAKSVGWGAAMASPSATAK